MKGECPKRTYDDRFKSSDCVKYLQAMLQKPMGSVTQKKYQFLHTYLAIHMSAELLPLNFTLFFFFVQFYVKV